MEEYIKIIRQLLLHLYETDGYFLHLYGLMAYIIHSDGKVTTGDILERFRDDAFFKDVKKMHSLLL